MENQPSDLRQSCDQPSISSGSALFANDLNFVCEVVRVIKDNLFIALRKHASSNVLEILQQKKDNFQIK